MPEIQTADPAVSRAKFERETALYREMEASYRAKGWFLLDATFPEVFVVFAATKVKPPVIVAGVVIDFTNYDLRPPSVRFVDPFTREPLMAKDLRFAMLRRPQVPGATPETVAEMMLQGLPPQNMIQSHGPEELPFLCLPGTREYHDHPAHTGDAWLLHRRSGEGSLHFVLEQIWKYGVNPLEQFQVTFQLTNIAIAGLGPSHPQAIPA